MMLEAQLALLITKIWYNSYLPSWNFL